MRNISTLLVANRGEIAVRVLRTAKALGIKTVAVYSDVDADAMHVRDADQAVRLGPAPVGESYLRADLVLAAAVEAGADAIHPGYGFLSERADFADAVAAAGLVFVGPARDAIDIMGDKARAKRAMIAAGVPCVPGYQGEDQSDATLIEQAQAIGYPIMVKASAGGGGRGMRVVEQAEALPEAIKLARSEAENAFGSGALILERALLSPRHVEIQVFADAHGTVIHLGERDCSVQRRHQKVIEEAPCPVMTPDLRVRMGQAAVEAARAVDYRGAGTVEFLLDPSGEFYFLEMNTRLQVEHPVTEAVTGLDLVALQLRVAAGQPLGLGQDDVRLTGHAIEVRLYAEDPDRDFLPSTGLVKLFRSPEMPNLRVDAGVESGGEVSPYYDPMVAKIITHGSDREEARRKAVQALGETAMFGPNTNRDFLIDALQQPEFTRGEATTAFIGNAYGDAGFASPPPGAKALACAAVVLFRAKRADAQMQALDVQDELLDWSSDGARQSVFVTAENGATHTVIARGGDRYQVLHQLAGGEVESVSVSLLRSAQNTAVFEIDGSRLHAVIHVDADKVLHIATPSRTFTLWDRGGLASGDDKGDSGRVVAPMHGKLISIDVELGQTVNKGQRLAVLEAMKMQHEIKAQMDGTVGEIAARSETQIAADDLIMQLEPGREPKTGTDL